MDYEYKIVRIMPMLAGPKYGEEPADATRSMLIGLLSDQYRRKNQDVSGDTLASTAGYLDNDIRYYYGSTITGPEAKLAMEWGLHGEYGEFTGLNADRLFRFVRSYAESPERQEAVKRTKAPDMGRQDRLTAEEIGMKNWEAMLEYAMQSYREYMASGSLPGTHPEAVEGFAGALLLAQRHNEASCYRWLKTMGVVNTDADTAAAEAGSVRNAARRLRRQADVPSVKVLADAMMLEGLFRTVEATGYDFPARMAELADTPESERRFW